MLSRRSFFAAAAGALAGAAGVAAAAPAPVVTSFDLGAGVDRSAIWSPSVVNDFARRTRYEQMEELFETIRGQELPPWPYALPNDLTREQYAANLPVIGRDALPADKPVPRACKPGAPAKETQEQYRRRVGTKCPGMLE